MEKLIVWLRVIALALSILALVPVVIHLWREAFRNGGTSAVSIGGLHGVEIAIEDLGRAIERSRR